jgi:hypothetical protein
MPIDQRILAAWVINIRRTAFALKFVYALLGPLPNSHHFYTLLL